jgi:hypothetical protein
MPANHSRPTVATISGWMRVSRVSQATCCPLPAGNATATIALLLKNTARLLERGSAAKPNKWHVLTTP